METPGMHDRIAILSTLVPLVVVLLGLASCNSASRTGGSGADPLQSIVGEWTVERLGGQDVAAMLPAGAPLPDLTIGSDGRVSGFGGVNRLSSTLDMQALAAGEFALTPIASTRMAGPPAMMEVESRFMGALESATRFHVDGDALVLQRDQETVLEMRRASGG
jgi:heat shock protein HslJ